MEKKTDNLLRHGLWSNSSNKEDCKDKFGCSSYPGVPKTRCPPAKPPRRKLSYPCDSSRLISGSSDLSFKSGGHDVLSGPTSLPACINQAIKPNTSKDSTPAPLDGSDYGSLQGDLWPPRTTNSDPNWQRFPKQTSNFCSTPSAANFFSEPNYFTPVPSSPSSTYFTPTGTPWSNNSRNLPFDLNKKKLNVPFLVSKITPTHRRHHSDPQITLERKPSLSRRPFLPGVSQGSLNRRSQSFASSHSKAQATGNPEFCQFNSDPLVLIEEVRMLREICNKLWEDLQNTQCKLEVLQNHSHGATGKPQFSELLSEVYYAQKERDQAVQQRLESAFKARDQALKQVEHMKDFLIRCNIRDSTWSDEEEPDCSNGNQSLEHVLNSLESCWSPSRLHLQREKLLCGVRRANDVRQQGILKELQGILQQRDRALAKAELLSQELARCCCKGNASWECNGHTKEDRSKALQRMEKLEDELESLRLCYSLQNSLDGASNGLSVCTQLASSSEGVQRKLQEETQARLEAQKECMRLERWVSVLIKKLNGLSVGVAV